MLGNPGHTGNTFKLATYLLSYSDDDDQKHIIHQATQLPNYAQYTNQELRAELLDVLKKLKSYHDPGLAGFQHYRQNIDKHIEARQEKSDMLEAHHVYDKYILGVLKEFVIITLAFLIKLEKMHKKRILCGNVSPYNFMYNRVLKQCEPCDLSVVLSEKGQVQAEEQRHGNLIYVVTDLNLISYNKYLAPELKQSILVYTLQRKLKNLIYAMETRGLILEQQADIKKLLLDFHQKKAKYSNKAEIYSVGYSINQILSHMLSKLTHLGLGLNEPVQQPVDETIIAEADLLLPDHFENHSDERVTDLLNEAVEYIHDLMHEHVEQRDSLPESIEKFRSLLKRITATQPHFILEHEGPEVEEAEFAVLHDEGHEIHIHSEHEHDHAHGDHDAHHDAHDHGGGHDEHDESHAAHGGGHDDHDSAHDDHHGGTHDHYDEHHASHSADHDDHQGGHDDAHNDAHHDDGHGVGDHSIGGHAHQEHAAHDEHGDHDDHDDHDHGSHDDDHHYAAHDDHKEHTEHSHGQHAAGHESHDGHSHDSHTGHDKHTDSHDDKHDDKHLDDKHADPHHTAALGPAARLPRVPPGGHRPSRH